ATPRDWPWPRCRPRAGASAWLAAREGAPRPPRSERLDDPGHVRGLGENDHAIADLEHVVPVWEERRAIPHDGADERAVDRHVAERGADVATGVARRHVQHFVAVALEHRDLLRPGVE